MRGGHQRPQGARQKEGRRRRRRDGRRRLILRLRRLPKVPLGHPCGQTGGVAVSNSSNFGIFLPFRAGVHAAATDIVVVVSVVSAAIAAAISAAITAAAITAAAVAATAISAAITAAAITAAAVAATAISAAAVAADIARGDDCRFSCNDETAVSCFLS